MRFKQITIGLFFIISFLIIGSVRAQKKDIVDYVNPLIGTPEAGFKEGLDGGGTMPCVGPPFAMTNFVVQTSENKISRMPYVYEDDSVLGFMATHQPTVWMGDYGYVSIMPQIGELRLLPKERALSYSHDNEASKPHYYSVTMDAGNQKIKGEIAATSRVGFFKFTYPESDNSHLIIQGINITENKKPFQGYLEIDVENKEIRGYNPQRMSSHLGPDLPNFKGYFVIKLDREFKDFGTWNSFRNEPQITVSGTEQKGARMGAYISFKTKENEQIKVKIATSFISIEQARRNLEIEVPHWEFEKVVKETRAIWQENLSRIDVKGASEDQKSIFYTALFHTMLFPREFSEYGRYYSAFDDKVHEGISYNDYSLWDTFRALHPLLHFTQPERVSPMIQSLLQMYQEGGWLPKWPNPTYSNIMIGTHADAVIADAYIKGFRGYDVELAYEAIRKNAMHPPYQDTEKVWGDRDEGKLYEARGGLTYYHSLGYVPSDKTRESVTRTIEFGIDDFTIAQMAKDLGKTDDYNRLMNWSKNYKNLFNKKTGFMNARLFNGDWAKNTQEGFTEGGRWTYLFGAMHDIDGSIELFGGKEAFASKLNENFEDNHYRHDNEPGHHYAYLFNYAGQPWKTQELIRKHTSVENYRNAPLGINGNDDCGQMSAWYVFGVMGFYPVTPGTEIYAIGAPQFPELTLRLTNKGKKNDFKIVANNLSENNMYVQSVTLDGKRITKPFITYSQIINGNELVFEMGKTANANAFTND
ncbi:GH92 family glycosyl hydrolase [Sabulilitoribacter arenilitoris]|uniref:GH92 family glycosyl hydrolase n=1 Tax=Wocania arenilitoris TaxID=2044858 RepID=A0AAE3ERK7_9FLAO|nr:GH92 family glycosyl hydrolase [Wocania arenilitoris]MCF7568785.1 GH92 family glycosyl hydrolase [Wocania arenilitoris]